MTETVDQASLQGTPLYNLPPDLRALHFATMEVLDAMVEMRNRAAEAHEAGRGFLLSNKERAEFDELRLNAWAKFNAVRHEMALTGTIVFMLLRHVDIASLALQVLSGNAGTFPKEAPEGKKGLLDDLRDGFSRVSQQQHDEWVANIASELHCAAEGVPSQYQALPKFPSPSEADRQQPVSPNNSDSQAEFVFAQDGDGYYIVGFGECGNVRRLKGFDYIARLIRTPGRAVPMVQLIAGADDARITADVHSRQPMADNQTVEALRRKRQELQEDLEGAKREGNSAEEEHCKAELEQLEFAAKQMMGLGGNPRDLNNLPDKLRPSIHNAVKRACEALQQADPPMRELADHFLCSIGADGNGFIYRPPIGMVPWSFERPSIL